MSLSGLKIFKYLPAASKTENTNCKKCGFPTCMSFALKLSQSKTDSSKCPYISQELSDMLNKELKIQQNEIVFGENNIKTGNETVMFRHEKTFVNRTVVAITMYSDAENFDDLLKRISEYEIIRMGEIFKIEAVYLIDKGNIINAVKKISDKKLALIIETDDVLLPNKLEKYNINPVYKFISGKIPDIQGINICSTGKNIDELSYKTDKLIKSGLNNIVLDVDITDKNLQQSVELLTYIRRLAIIEKSDDFAFPVMTRIETNDIYKTDIYASTFICRYSNILILDVFNEALLTALYILRQNIYTDPQKPLQVESKIYEINEPDENSLVFMTTNFALTYFAVLNEISNLSISSYLIITPSDGMSVLTAWSAEKFTAKMAAKMINSSEKLKHVKNKRIIIPGLLADMKEELEEEMPEWEIIIGTNEAYQIYDFVTNLQ